MSSISRCSWNYNKFMQVKHHTWAAADYIALDCTGWFRRYNWCRTYCSTACKNLSLTNLLWIQQSHSSKNTSATHQVICAPRQMYMHMHTTLSSYHTTVSYYGCYNNVIQIIIIAELIIKKLYTWNIISTPETIK